MKLRSADTPTTERRIRAFGSQDLNILTIRRGGRAMRVNTFKTFAAAAVLTTFGLALVNANAPDMTLKSIVGYRQWTRINEKPIQVALDGASFAA